MSRRRRRAVLILAALSGGLGLGGWQLAQSRSEAREAAEHWTAGAAAARSGEWEAARKSWTACLKLAPDQPDCGAGLSLLSHADSSFDAGLVEQKDLRARSIISQSVTEEADRAFELLRTGKFAEAESVARTALALDSRSVAARSVLLLARSRVSGSVLPEPAPGAGAPGSALPEAAEADKDRANAHWNAGIKFFQKGDYEKARDEWLLCGQFDAGNADCATGLKRIDATFGGGQ